MTSSVPGGDTGARILGTGLVLPDPIPRMLPSVPSPRLTAGPVYACSELPPLALGNTRMLRRLSRAHHLALSAATQALGEYGRLRHQAEVTGISLGTGLGVVGDTTVFLQNMIEQGEQNPKPTCFINSVHNAPAAQIAICLGLRGPNNTFIHESISFELALWRALRMIETREANQVLVVGVDEASPYVITAGEHLGWLRRESGPLDPMASSGVRTRGTLPGEGAAALLLCGAHEAPQDARVPHLAKLRVEPLAGSGVAGAEPGAEAEFVLSSLESIGLAAADVDLFLLGANGSAELDDAYGAVVRALRGAGELRCAVFKSVCGEFCAAAAVGVALSALAVRDGRIPSGIRPLRPVNCARPASCVAFYNLYETGYHSICVVKV